MPQDSLTHTQLGIPDSTPPETALIIYPAGAVVLRRNPLSLCAFFGLMPADQTTHCCAYDAVMAGIMASDTADDRAFQTTLG